MHVHLRAYIHAAANLHERTYPHKRTHTSCTFTRPKAGYHNQRAGKVRRAYELAKVIGPISPARFGLCKCQYTCLCIHLYVSAHMSLHMSVHMSVHTCAHVCTRVHVRVCILDSARAEPQAASTLIPAHAQLPCIASLQTHVDTDVDAYVYRNVSAHVYAHLRDATACDAGAFATQRRARHQLIGTRLVVHMDTCMNMRMERVWMYVSRCDGPHGSQYPAVRTGHPPAPPQPNRRTPQPKLREGAGTSRSRERERDRDREWWRRRAEGERVRSSLVSIASARWPCARCGLMSRAFIIISRLYTSLYTCLQSDILCISSRCVHLYLLLQ